MRTQIKDYLRRMGYKINDHALDIIEACDSWYCSEQIDDFHNRTTVNGLRYEMSRTGFAKRACEDDANLCEVVEITLNNDAANTFIQDTLRGERFQRGIREQLELIAAEGTAAAYVRAVGAEVLEDGTLRGGALDLVFVRPSGVYPLRVEKGIVTECAFSSVDVVGTEVQTTIVIFRCEEGIYHAITGVLDHDGTELEDRYVDVTLGEIKPFAVLTTAAVNNLRGMTGYGYPKIYAAIPELKALDLIFNVLFGDLDTADKMVLYNEALCDFDEQGNPKTPNRRHKRTFVSMGKKLPEAKGLVQEINPEIRVEEITKTFELVLSLLSIKFGYGSRKYSFEGGQIKTATEYIGTKQDSMQELNRQRQNVTDYICEIIRALLWFSNTFHGTAYDLDTEVVIDYDDSFISDRESELEAMRADADTFGLPKLVKNYLRARYNLTEEEAEAWYSDSDLEENPIKPVGVVGGGLAPEQIDTEGTKRVALNGAQVNALMEVIQRANDRDLNVAQATSLLVTSFGLAEEEAKKLILGR